MSSPLIFMPNRRTSAVAVGRGTPGQRDGCIGLASSGSRVPPTEARGSISILVSLAQRRALNPLVILRATKSLSRIRTRLRESVCSIEVDGASLAAGSMDIQLADDSAAHHVRVILDQRKCLTRAPSLVATSGYGEK